jgi:hypothetical protein
LSVNGGRPDAEKIVIVLTDGTIPIDGGWHAAWCNCVSIVLNASKVATLRECCLSLAIVSSSWAPIPLPIPTDITWAPAKWRSSAATFVFAGSVDCPSVKN